MNRSSPSPGLHPLVCSFVRDEAHILKLLEDFPKPLSPILNALLMLRLALVGRVPVAEALAAADAIDIDAEDPNLAIMLLMQRQSLCLDLKRLSEGEAALHRAQGLLSDDTPLELRAWVVRSEGVVAQQKGDRRMRETCVRRALKILAKSKNRTSDILELAFLLSRIGRGVEMMPEVDRFAARVGPEHHRYVEPFLIKFFHCVETGRAADGLALLSDVLKDKERTRYYARSLWIYRIVIDLMIGQWKPESLPDPSAFDRAYDAERIPQAPAWALSTHFLLRRDPQPALIWARASAETDFENVIWVGFMNFILIRAELAAGNASAARRLLEQRRQEGSDFYLDEFFWARTELLAGDFEAAARHFRRVCAEVRRYEAEPRLDFELRLACELSPGDVMRLTAAAGQAGDASALREVTAAVSALPPQGVAHLVGESAAISRIRETILQVAPAGASVLVRGETGTGKELVARAIHESGPKKDQPFVAINCGAIADTLLQSELFGHERGAFTGASRTHRGLFEEAGEGTLFLDEIGEITPPMQVALLRVLESGQIRPVGSAQSRTYACRVVAATNAPLEAWIEEGRFRRDLFYRLNRVEIQVPPLRERPADILPLARHFLDSGREPGVSATLSPALVEALRTRSWPGNIRELRNEIERMRLLNSDKLFYDVQDLTSATREPSTRGGHADSKRGPSDPLSAPLSPTANPAPRASASPAHADAAAFLREGRTRLRRLDRLRDLFRAHEKLTRADVAHLLDTCKDTATRDLKLLCEEGFVERIAPSASPRSCYFVLRRET